MWNFTFIVIASFLFIFLKVESDSIICGNEGCNKTQTPNDDDILTDIVVRVKTSQKRIKSNETVEDTSEIPIITGISQSPIGESGNIYSDNFIKSNGGNENLFIPSLPTHNRQNYGEQPPQHFVWYPKGGIVHNPVEFKRFERPPTLHRVQYPQQFERRIGSTTCMCQNAGLNWYPTTPTFNYYNKKDGIDDKLEELNN
nr:uncharacterized protein LOC111425644 [Onthophagus taurus]